VTPNPRLQRTRWRSPLSRQPLGSRESPAAESASRAYGTVRKDGVVDRVGEEGLKSESVRQEQLRVPTQLESVLGSHRGAVPNPALQRTRSRSPLSARPLGVVSWRGA
jgi:hypothetical protein